MPNQSCTVILNGHGSYSTKTIISPNNYNIIFSCKPKIPVSNSHHNLTLAYICEDINNVAKLEMLPSTQKVNNSVQISTTMDMLSRHIRYTYEHELKNASDVHDVLSLYDIDQNRFAEQNQIVVDYSVRANWQKLNQMNQPIAQASFKINYDINQIKQDVLNAYQQNILPQVNSTINLSQSNIVFLTPTATNGESFSQTLSDLITDILPKIRIPVKYTPAQNPLGQQAIPASVDVSSSVYLNDGNKPPINFQTLVGQNDIYHEMTIAGDANIIWDACRDFAE